MASGTAHPSPPSREEFHRAIGAGADAWYAACLRITRDGALAQDAVQDALLSAWAKRHQFQAGSKLETWIHRIAVNAALSLIRRRRPEDGAEPDSLPDTQPTPPDQRSREELGRTLETALGDLSDMERLCFVLKHLEQWRLKEIAAELDTGVGPVKQALFRAVGKLRQSVTLERTLA